MVNPISGTNLIQGVAQLAAKNKTIVNIDSPIDAEAAKAANATPATYIGTDNVQAGEMAGKRMTQLLPSGGEVAAIGGISGDVTSGARIEGFTKGLGSKPKLAQTVAANWDRQEALTQADNVLRANPELAGFFVANDDMGLGVARAVADAGKTGKVKIISVDGIKDALEGGQGRRAGRRRGAVPVRDRQHGRRRPARPPRRARPCPPTSRHRWPWSPRTTPTRRSPPRPKPFQAYANPFQDLLK